MLQIHNTLTKQKEKFIPVDKKLVRIYVCGPTVYDFAHIGNFRSWLTADILHRWLHYGLGCQVRLVKNITDVGHLTQDDIEAGEDKIERAAKKQAKTPQEIARFFEQAFLQDEAQFNILPAEVYPRATDNINQMIAIIKTLLDKDLAYEKNGSIFYDVTKFKKYGALSGNTLDKLETGARLEPHPDKKHPYDFALWLKANPDHLLQWNSPWSRGYPGWHIECSAMSMRYLSKVFSQTCPTQSLTKARTPEINFNPDKFQTIDFHTGGEDNIFPHHENEIAQSEGATNKQFIKYWLHTKHLLVDGQKMSKSLDNFYTLRNLIAKNYNPLAFRLLMLSSHYRSQINFSFKGLDQAQTALNRITDFVLSLREVPHFYKSEGRRGNLEPTITDNTLHSVITIAQKDFESNLNDDLNTPQAIAVVFDFIRDINKTTETEHASLSPANAKTIYDLMIKFDKILGLGLDKIQKPETQDKIPQKVQELFNKRNQARQQKNFSLADNLRQQISQLGYRVLDTDQGSKLEKM
ncbi:MAG: cysteine--tRNA ligase [Candidatus Portnoybacteria bacterium CG06_land_8_20_14_3_00_39_12]|uniref:Cysteine--tRNA ligase n=2 Tax=Candidatus Portnoyibacteriota TaxID=1817913 RepID=A0A2M7AX72_9BACT|nr:MAG: cysteine--tRNA ligase [Candidatus Portnoybacteria bacterium CG06_land_8_20_14_3_00_39_12]